MKNIELLQKDYIEELNKQYLYWKTKYEEDNTNDAYLDMVNLSIDAINHFDDAYGDMIEQESRSFLSLVLSRVRQYKDPFIDQEKKITSYTRLGFRENDVLVINFIKHAKHSRGYVSEDSLVKFINSVKKELINVDKKSEKIEKMLRESQTRMKPIDQKIKVKGAK